MAASSFGLRAANDVCSAAVSAADSGELGESTPDRGSPPYAAGPAKATLTEMLFHLGEIDGDCCGKPHAVGGAGAA
ncbi:MAG: hypothetical protein ABW321_30345 [Polyangiales bacterium]